MTKETKRSASKALANAGPAPVPPKAPLNKIEAVHGKLTLEGSKDSHAYVERALGSDSGEFQAYCLTMLVNVLAGGKENADFTLDMNAALAMLQAIGPQDELEAMLAVQMVASNHLALSLMRRTSHASAPETRQLHGNLSTKFSRTFVAQMEALNRHRRGGKQIVEHVHVNAGGQAVIAGTVNAGGRGA